MKVLVLPTVRRIATAATAFAIAGPPLGGIALALVDPIARVAEGRPLSSNAIAALIGIVMISWIYGAIPAAATGVAHAFISTRSRGLTLCLLTGASGAILSFLWLLHEFQNVRDALWVGSLAGFFAGFLMACIALAMWPNNSFKPKPLRGSA